MPTELPPDITAALIAGCGAAGRRDLADAGATDNDLRRWVRRGQLIRVRDGAYVLPLTAMPGETDGWYESHAAALLAGTDVVISHRSAALMHGLPIARALDVPEVTRDERGTRIAGVRVHRYGVQPADITAARGLRVTTPARTVADLCRVTEFADALMACDAALRAGRATKAEMFAVIDALGDINFRKRAIEVVAAADPAAESPLESRSRGVLLEAEVPAPRLQWWIGDGRHVWFRPDLLWWLWGIVGECDGRAKYQKPSVLWQEKRRQEWIEDQGLAVVRWTDQDVRGSQAEGVRRWEAARRRQIRFGWTPPPGLWLVPPGPWPPSRPSLRNFA